MRGYIVSVSGDRGERYVFDSMTTVTHKMDEAKVYKTESGAIRAANRIAFTKAHEVTVIPVDTCIVPVTSYVSVRKAAS